jgi:hypothetical protein
MTNILLRTPYYISATQAGASYAVLTLTVDGEVRYTLTNDVNASESVLFEISELAADYLDITYDGTYTSQTLDVSTLLRFYDSSDLQVGPDVTSTHVGFYGYSEFTQGSNYEIPTDSVLLSNTKIYALEGSTGYVPVENANAIEYLYYGSGATSISAGGSSLPIIRICEPRFDPIMLTFVNKFGALQDLWLFKKSTKTLEASRESFKRAIISGDGSYNTTVHSKSVLSATGSESVSANTGYISEDHGEVLAQLYLSEQVWATQGGVITPVNITANSLKYLTSVNDKLMNYTIEFEYAFDKINNIR